MSTSEIEGMITWGNTLHFGLLVVQSYDLFPGHHMTSSLTLINAQAEAFWSSYCIGLLLLEAGLEQLLNR